VEDSFETKSFRSERLNEGTIDTDTTDVLNLYLTDSDPLRKGSSNIVASLVYSYTETLARGLYFAKELIQAIEARDSVRSSYECQFWWMLPLFLRSVLARSTVRYARALLGPSHHALPSCSLPFPRLFDVSAAQEHTEWSRLTETLVLNFLLACFLLPMMARS